MKSIPPFASLARFTPVLLIVAISSVVSASENALERQMLADASDGRLDRFTLLEAALLAGGDINERDFVGFRQSFHARRLDLKHTLAGHEEDDAAKAIFELLHREILTGEYSRNCTQVQMALRGEEYNCVTATVLYHSMATDYGVQMVAVATPGHVFSQLADGRDVETTCADWFDRTGPQPRPAAADRRVLTPVELIAKIYYNRAVLYLEDHNFGAAIEALDISLTLDPADNDAQENRSAAYNNWSLDHSAQGRYAEACELLAIGRAADPEYAHFKKNEQHVRQCWVQQLCNRHQYQKALQVIEEGATHCEGDLFRHGPAIVKRMWADNTK